MNLGCTKFSVHFGSKNGIVHFPTSKHRCGVNIAGPVLFLKTQTVFRAYSFTSGYLKEPEIVESITRAN